MEHRSKCVPEIKKQLELCRKLVGFYNRSTTFQKVLSRQQDILDAPKNGLIQDVVTRWNSSLFMIERIIQQQRTITLACIDFPEVEMPNFDLLKNISLVLSPFDTFTRQLSLRYESISSVLSTYRCLLAILRENDSDSPITIQFKRVVINGLKTRMQKYENKRFLILATLIDPRYKNHQNIFDFADRIQNRILLKTELELLLSPERRPSDTDSNSGNINCDPSDPLANFLSTREGLEGLDHPINSQASQKIESETEDFFKAPTVKRDSDPLEFWRQNTTYPQIKKMVPKYLCAPPSSVESERTFSKLSEIYSPNRSSLSAEHAMQQLFLYFNFDE